MAHRGVYPNGSPVLEQKQVDILLAIELVRLSMRRAIDKAVLVTGDSDFVPAINIAKDEGVQVILAHAERPHESLVNSVDQRIRIDRDFINGIRRENS